MTQQERIVNLTLTNPASCIWEAIPALRICRSVPDNEIHTRHRLQ